MVYLNLDWKKIKYKTIDAEKEAELSKDLGIKQAPTLVVVNNGKVEKYSNISDIKKYLGSKECVTA